MIMKHQSITPYQEYENSMAHRRHTSYKAQSLKQSSSLSYGGLHINYLLYFFIPILVGACIYSYHAAVSTKQEPPFPHATITSTACHYPQDIIFRFLMLPAGGFICLIYYVAYRWVKLLQIKTGYPGPTFHYLFYWGQASVLGFYGAIATIDESKRPPIHGIGAVFFFILLYIISTSLTIVIRDIRAWDTTITSRRSILYKAIFSGYLLIVVIYFLIGSLLENNDNGEDIYLVTIEWNLTLVGLTWLLTFVLDFQDVQITLKGNVDETLKKIELNRQ